MEPFNALVYELEFEAAMLTAQDTHRMKVNHSEERNDKIAPKETLQKLVITLRNKMYLMFQC